MKKIFVICFVIFVTVLMSACDGGPLYDVYYPRQVVVDPDEDTRYNINGYKDTSVNSSIQSDSYSEQDTGQDEKTLIGNKKSKVVHKFECSYIKSLKEENCEIFDSLDNAILNGYSKCSRCFK